MCLFKLKKKQFAFKCFVFVAKVTLVSHWLKRQQKKKKLKPN